MKKFEYFQPSSIGEALDLISISQTKILAGGTDYIILLKKNMINPKRVVDINGIAVLNQLKEDGKNIKIGALIRHSDIRNSVIIKENATALHEACSNIGSPQIRNLGTVVGNIANASPAADSAPALLVLNAQVILESIYGSHTVELEKYFIGPGKTVLKDNEIISGVIIEKQDKNTGSAFYKIGKRKALAISIVSAAAFIQLENDKETVKQLRLAFGSVAAKPVRAFEIEKLSRGLHFNDVKHLIMYKTSEVIDPIDDIRSTKEYRSKIAPIVAVRALNIANERAIYNMR